MNSLREKKRSREGKRREAKKREGKRREKTNLKFAAQFLAPTGFVENIHPLCAKCDASELSLVECIKWIRGSVGEWLRLRERKCYMYDRERERERAREREREIWTLYPMSYSYLALTVRCQANKVLIHFGIPTVHLHSSINRSINQFNPIQSDPIHLNNQSITWIQS